MFTGALNRTLGLLLYCKTRSNCERFVYMISSIAQTNAGRTALSYQTRWSCWRSNNQSHGPLVNRGHSSSKRRSSRRWQNFLIFHMTSNSKTVRNCSMHAALTSYELICKKESITKREVAQSRFSNHSILSGDPFDWEERWRLAHLKLVIFSKDNDREWSLIWGRPRESPAQSNCSNQARDDESHC